jgi:hypothetical protein
MKRILADCIFLFHCLVVAIIGFGWALPSIWYLYMLTLFVTLISEVALGYCFLSKWEFDLRKQIDPSVDYDYGFSSYYTYKLTHHRLSKRFIANAALFFLVASLAINLYFKFL